MIKLDNLAKIFRTEELETAALMDVSLHIEVG
jgi:ABC-type methionine transport system ATPase subunit